MRYTRTEYYYHYHLPGVKWVPVKKNLLNAVGAKTGSLAEPGNIGAHWVPCNLSNTSIIITFLSVVSNLVSHVHIVHVFTVLPKSGTN